MDKVKFLKVVKGDKGEIAKVIDMTPKPVKNVEMSVVLDLFDMWQKSDKVESGKGK